MRKVILLIPYLRAGIPKGLNRIPKGLNRIPKDLNRTPKGLNRIPKGLNRIPKGLSRIQKGLGRIPKGPKQNTFCLFPLVFLLSKYIFFISFDFERT
jgi:hypothetical protein